MTVRDRSSAGDSASGSRRRIGMVLLGILRSFFWSEPRGVVNRIGGPIAGADEPLLATETMIPPLALHAGDVGALVQVGAPLVDGWGAPRALAVLAAETELVDAPHATVRAS